MLVAMSYGDSELFMVGEGRRYVEGDGVCQVGRSS